MSKARIIITVNADWYFWSHRLTLAKALRDAGHEVVVATGIERGCDSAIKGEGFRFVPLRLRRRSSSLTHELSTVFELFQLYRRERPNLVHHVTIKPVLYGSIAAKLARVPAVINTVPGLGYLFQVSGIRGAAARGVASTAYRLALSGNRTRTIFQNPDDRELFLSSGLVSPRRAIMVRGSGVDISQFTPSNVPEGTPIVLLAARLLWDKGVGELVEAARLLKVRGVTCRVVLVGVPDLENPNSVAAADLERWQAEGVVEWWGLRNDMPEVIRMATVVALPSYYGEGVPKILLEAAASSRPIVTTDMPGCREIVRHGENGLLVPARDPRSLADAIEVLIRTPAMRTEMGLRGREIVVAEFSEERVLNETLAIYSELLGKV